MQGIDVSKWQGRNIDFQKVKASGISFVIIRAGYRLSIDECWELNYKKAKEAGLHVGAYWYMYALNGDQALKEAEAFLTALKGKQLDMPVYYDCEDKSVPVSMWCENASAFCHKVEQAGYFTGMYTSESFLKYFTDDFKKKFTLWIASWGKGLSTATYPTMGIQQTSSKGSVLGISGNVDMDNCFVDFPTVIRNACLNGFSKSTQAVQNNSQRSMPVNYLKGFLGITEGSEGHLSILKTFNDSGLCPRYRMTKNDAWCATAVSSAFIASGLTSIFPCVECSCYYMIQKAQSAGIWVEDDSYVPQEGDVILYDWGDSGSGDNKGVPDHVGIVVSCDGKNIKVIEGNISNTVGYRTIAVNGKYIRGFITPKYSSGTAQKTPTLKSVDQVAKEVLNGLWGNGDDRKNRLTSAGYNYSAVQKRVNELLSPKKSVDQLAHEVLQGKWGNGNDRKTALEKAGYNYSAIQKRVNQLVSGK